MIAAQLRRNCDFFFRNFAQLRFFFPQLRTTAPQFFTIAGHSAIAVTPQLRRNSIAIDNMGSVHLFMSSFFSPKLLLLVSCRFCSFGLFCWKLQSSVFQFVHVLYEQPKVRNYPMNTCVNILF